MQRSTASLQYATVSAFWYVKSSLQLRVMLHMN